MTSKGFEPTDFQKFFEQLASGASQEELAALLSEGAVPQHSGGGSPFDWRRPEPKLHPVPEVTRGLRIRLELLDTEPPVWRRLEVSGDITLSRLHEVLQAAMGWTNSHLHGFRTGKEPGSPVFLTEFDLSEGDEGTLEDGVRLDQVVAAEGDRLWYDYDFGDNWEHVLRVEAVLEDPPLVPRCIAGQLACPPEDCGGIPGYEALADWVRSGHKDSLLPPAFDDPEHAHDWMPEGWHPDVFDLEKTNKAIAAAAVEPPPVIPELTTVLELTQSRGSRALHEAIAHPAFRGPAEVNAEDAAVATEPFRILLEVLGDGAELTSAGKLKPAHVLELVERTGMREWWIGQGNREDRTWPVARLREAARALGLVSVRKGRIAPTQAAKRLSGDPVAMLAHIASRLPIGRDQFDQEAGWAALVVAGSETPVELWSTAIQELLFEIGWRQGDGGMRPAPESPTLHALDVLAGATRHGWRLTGVVPAVVATARAATRPGGLSPASG